MADDVDRVTEVVWDGYRIIQSLPFGPQRLALGLGLVEIPITAIAENPASGGRSATACLFSLARHGIVNFSLSLSARQLKPARLK
jgi:hypothetical protein